MPPNSESLKKGMRNYKLPTCPNTLGNSSPTSAEKSMAGKALPLPPNE